METPRNERRRLHSRAGAIALGAFVVLHLVSNASALRGEAAYARIAGALQQSRWLPLIEIAVFVPLVVHAALGLRLLRARGDDEPAIARHGDRRWWALQRATAALLGVFLLGHLWELRLAKTFAGMPASAFYTVLTAHMSWTWHGVPWIAVFYLVGLGTAAFHVANGVHAAARWGRADEPRRALRVATAIGGCLLFLIGGATVLALATGTVFLPAPEPDQPCVPAQTRFSAGARSR